MYTLHRIGNKWHVYFRDRDGNRVRQTTKQTEKSKARAVADDLYRRLADPTYRAANETTIATAAQWLVSELRNTGKSEQTVGHFYNIKLRQIKRLLGADTPLTAVTAASVDKYIEDRRKEGASSNTISKELTALRQLLKRARRGGHFDREISQVLPVGFATGYEPRSRKITQEQCWQLIAEVPDNVGRYIAFVAATSARDAAVRRAMGADRTAAGILVRDKKTQLSERTVPITPVTQAFADHAFAGVSPNQRVAPSTTSVRHALERACARLQMPRISPNDIRRSVAHWLLAEDVPRPLVSAWMGHASTRMLDRVYGKLDPSELAAAMARAFARPKSVQKARRNVKKPAENTRPGAD